MPSEVMCQVAERIRQQREATGGGRPDIDELRRSMESMAPPVPADVRAEQVEVEGIHSEWVLAPDADPDRRILYLHGGTYTAGSPLTHRRLAADVGRAAACAVLVIDYRLAPEDPYPAALNDARAAYRWLKRRGPTGRGEARSLFIVGDAAGGGLALATMMRLRDAGDRQPNAAATISAWTDLALSGDSWKSRAELDPVLQRDVLVDSPYAGSRDPRQPGISPLYGDFRGLPPLLLQVGDHEVLLDDSVRVAEHAREAGVRVTLEVEPEAFHVYQYFAAMIPEGRDAIDRIGAFLKQYG